VHPLTTGGDGADGRAPLVVERRERKRGRAAGLGARFGPVVAHRGKEERRRREEKVGWLGCDRAGPGA